MSQLWSHEQMFDGYTKTHKTVSTKTISVSYGLDRYAQEMYDIPQELIERELAYKLAAEIMKCNGITHQKHFDQETFQDTIIASITVCPAEMKFRNIQNESFVVNGEHFSEQEIINAIKQTYPDRLI